MNTRVYTEQLQQILLDLNSVNESRVPFYVEKIENIITDIELELEDG